jgi:hypothetical protein
MMLAVGPVSGQPVYAGGPCPPVVNKRYRRGLRGESQRPHAVASLGLDSGGLDADPDDGVAEAYGGRDARGVASSPRADKRSRRRFTWGRIPLTS